MNCLLFFLANQKIKFSKDNKSPGLGQGDWISKVKVSHLDWSILLKIPMFQKRYIPVR